MTHAKLTEIRTAAVGLAAAFFPDGMAPDFHALWKLARFFEEFALGGAEATREEFGPKVALTVVPKIGIVK